MIFTVNQTLRFISSYCPFIKLNDCLLPEQCKKENKDCYQLISNLQTLPNYQHKTMPSYLTDSLNSNLRIIGAPLLNDNYDPSVGIWFNFQMLTLDLNCKDREGNRIFTFIRSIKKWCQAIKVTKVIKKGRSRLFV